MYCLRWLFIKVQDTMGWYQFLKSPEIDCDNWKFSYSKKGWTSRSLGLAWVQHFHKMTKGSIKAGVYRMLIVDGHGSHISIEFIEFCLTVNIIAYCLPPHSTHLLQPLDVGLFSPLQKAYGKTSGSSCSIRKYCN